MRRKKQEITDQNEIFEIIQKAEICRLGLAVDNTPYIVPVNYGYEDNCLYIHCAKEGRKIDMIRKNNTVCFEMDVDTVLFKTDDDSACKCGTTYRSIIGYGKASIVEDFDQKKKALDILMKHYSSKDSFHYTESPSKTSASSESKSPNSAAKDPVKD